MWSRPGSVAGALFGVMLGLFIAGLIVILLVSSHDRPVAWLLTLLGAAVGLIASVVDRWDQRRRVPANVSSHSPHI